VKKVGLPFSQDSSEMKGTRENFLEQSFIHMSIVLHYDSGVKLSLSINPFLIQKQKILSNGDFLLFKEEDPFDTI
jgi:hypothetical protein